MMKIWLVIAMTFAVCTVYAQGAVEIKTDAFTEVKVFDGIAVELIPSSTNKVEVSGEDADQVVVKNSSGKLKIRMNMNKLFKGHKTFAKVYYQGRLSVLDVNENASITASNPIEQVDLELRAQEAGEIDLEVNLERLKVKTVTGSTIAVKGRAKNQVVEVNTGGGYEAGYLETEQTEVTVNAGGFADIRASEYVDATVKAGGNINIYGKPKVIDQTTFLGGVIREL